MTLVVSGTGGKFKTVFGRRSSKSKPCSKLILARGLINGRKCSDRFDY
jgi:hypothetical protein